MSSTEILIVDNDEGVLNAVATRLEDAGYTCITAQSGAQALSLYNSERTGLVITDLNMPNGNGIDLIHSVRDRANTPIVAISGFYDSFEKKLSACLNVTVFKKPFDSAALLDLVEVELLSPMHQAA